MTALIEQRAAQPNPARELARRDLAAAQKAAAKARGWQADFTETGGAR